MSEQREIGKICNYYGGLSVKQEGGKYFWSIEDWEGEGWEEIPKYLFDALNKHQDELDQYVVTGQTNVQHVRI